MSSKLDDVTLASRYSKKGVRASESGIEFSLSFKQYKKIYNKRKCQYTGIPFKDVRHPELHKYARTLERIDPNKGYVLGNCIVVCHMINQFKSTMDNSSTDITIDNVIAMSLKLIKLKG